MENKAAQKKTDLVEAIIEITATFYGVELADFKINKSGKQECVYRRHMCYFMIREYTFSSYDNIGLYFGTVQSTIKFGVHKIEDLNAHNRRCIAEIKDIKKLIDNFKANKMEQSLVN